MYIDLFKLNFNKEIVILNIVVFFIVNIIMVLMIRFLKFKKEIIIFRMSYLII